ncbi:MAG: hypothetical protein ABSD74_15235 [Rhizomicrobium sp.]|jgi:hypothetical protein
MKHAGPEALDRLEALLDKLRKIAALKEKSRGVFYRAGRSCLHFHEHGAELYADLRTGGDFERFPATSKVEQTALLKLVNDSLVE